MVEANEINWMSVDYDRALMEKLEPLLRRIIREEMVSSKILVGAKAIKSVLGIKSTKTLMKYYTDHGFPMAKGLRGHWQVHSDAIKDWMGTRSLMGRKATELGFDVRGRGGASRYARLERLDEHQMGLVVAGIREDSLR